MPGLSSSSLQIIILSLTEGQIPSACVNYLHPTVSQLNITSGSLLYLPQLATNREGKAVQALLDEAHLSPV